MYLLDTPVVSEYLKKKPSKKVIDWLDEQDEHSLLISCLTIAELKKGYYKLQSKAASVGEKKRAEKVSTWIQTFEKRFQDRIVQIDAELLELWAIICGRREAEGKKLPVVDSLLVATAQTHGLVVVTRNVTDFENGSKSLTIYDPY
ncbi:MAG: type II toxin-antitoxin system VapC family toxin [Gammaproteobacteria bacterium]